MTRKISLFSLILFFAFGFLIFAQAQGGFIQCDPTKKLTQSGSCDLCGLLKSIEKIINWLTTISIPVAVGFIVYGAVVIMIAGGSTDRVQKGRNSITSAVIGLVITLAAWLLINEVMQLMIKQSLNPFTAIQC